MTCARFDDLCALQSVSHGPARVLLGDSREILEEIEDNSISAVITSPPYPNEKDYTRTTRLESVILGFMSSKEDLRAIKRNLVRSNTRGVYKDDIDDQWTLGFQRVHDLADEIERRRIELGKTSGFGRTYNRVVRLYLGGMARHLASLRRVLKPGARLAYVVGDQASYLRVMIRTGEIMSDIAASLGFQVESRDLFRTRIATATKEWPREEVVVLRWPGEGTSDRTGFRALRTQVSGRTLPARCRPVHGGRYHCPVLVHSRPRRGSRAGRKALQTRRA